MVQRISSAIRTKVLSVPFLSANLTMAPLTIVRFATGVIRTKVSALILGPAGVGIYSVGNQLQTLATSWGSMGMNAGFTRKLSAAVASGDHKTSRALISTVFVLQLCINLTLLGVGLFFAPELARAAFGAEGTAGYIVPLVISVPFYSFVSAHLLSICYGYGRYDLYTRAAVLSAFLEAILLIGLLYLFGLKGAFWGIAASGLVFFTSMTIVTRRLLPLREVFHFGFDAGLAGELFSSSFVMLATGSATYLANSLVRIHLVKSLGASQNGIYQVATVFTAYYTPFLTNGVWARFFPKVSAEGLTERVRHEWSDTLCVTAMFAVSAQLAILVRPSLVISALYTREFLNASTVLPIQLLGDFFFLLAQACFAVFLGTGRMRSYFIGWIVPNILLYFACVRLTPHYGVTGAALAYLFSNLFMAAIGMFAFVRGMGSLKAVLRTLGVLSVALVAVGLQSWLRLDGGTSGAAHLALRVLIFVAWLGIVGSVLHFPRLRKRVLYG